MDMETISRTKQLSWLGGIIDGEGCIAAYFWNRNDTKKRQPRLGVLVTIGNNDPILIKAVSSIFAELGYKFYYSLAKKGINKNWHMAISLRGQSTALKFLREVREYLQCKREQADKLIELIEYRQSLGYKPRPTHPDISQDPKLQELICDLKAMKTPMFSPSETRRRASHVLQIRGLDYA